MRNHLNTAGTAAERKSRIVEVNVANLRERVNRRGCRRDRGGVVDAPRNELRVVKQVVELAGQIESVSLPETEVFDQREVDVVDRPDWFGVAAAVCVGTLSRLNITSSGIVRDIGDDVCAAARQLVSVCVDAVQIGRAHVCTPGPFLY